MFVVEIAYKGVQTQLKFQQKAFAMMGNAITGDSDAIKAELHQMGIELSNEINYLSALKAKLQQGQAPFDAMASDTETR